MSVKISDLFKKYQLNFGLLPQYWTGVYLRSVPNRQKNIGVEEVFVVCRLCLLPKLIRRRPATKPNICNV